MPKLANTLLKSSFKLISRPIAPFLIITSLHFLGLMSSCDHGHKNHDQSDAQSENAGAQLAQESTMEPLGATAQDNISNMDSGQQPAATTSSNKANFGINPNGASNDQVSESFLLQDNRVQMLTPEQFSQTLALVFATQKNVNDYYQRTRDWVLYYYDVALGGVDFSTRSIRETAPSAQMFLAMREASFYYMTDIVNRDTKAWNNRTDPVLFKFANPTQDRPFSSADSKFTAEYQDRIRESEKLWTAQIDFYYQRLFHRSPREAEWTALRISFVSFMENNNGSVVDAWILTLTTLLMSSELWTI